MVRSNPILYDPRVIKISSSLSKRYEILILGWDRECEYAPMEIISESLKIKRFRLKAPYNRMRTALFLPIYQAWVLLSLLVYNPNLVHACDLDGAIPSYIFKIISRRKIVFDVFDRYCFRFLIFRRKKICQLIKLIEEVIASNSDCLIAVTKQQLDTFRRQPNSCGLVPNYPMDVKLNKHPSEMKVQVFTITFAGGIRSDRGLLEICKAIKELRDVKLVLVGKILDHGFLRRILSFPQVEYFGLLPYKEALELQAAADVIPVFVDPSLPGFPTVNPNKLFEAMMLSVPVITNVVTDNVVAEVGCGVVVPYADINEIRKAILYLKTNHKAEIEMGSKGRKAFKHKYNWDRVKSKLLQIYTKLLA